MKKDYRLLLKLFLNTLTLSAFTFGGGYVIVPLMKKKFIDDLKWLSQDEMMDLISIAQSTPGPIAINSSVLIGYRLAGKMGSLVAVCASILPPLVIITIISIFYDAFRSNIYVSGAIFAMQAGIAAIIVNIVYAMAKDIFKMNNIFYTSVMLLSFAFVGILKVNIIFVIAMCVIANILYTFFKIKKNQL